MSEAISTTNGAQQGLSDQGEDCRWIRCRGCGGEVGIPSSWTDSNVACPQCGQVVQAKGGILYRPAVQTVPPPQRRQALAPTAKGPSLELLQACDKVMVCGILSVVLGWTIIVPLLGICGYSVISEQAKKEQVLVPGKATLGLVLSLLFGAVQGLALIAHFCK